MVRVNDSGAPEETLTTSSSDTMHLPPEDAEDKDPPTYDSMYPGKASEVSQGRSSPAEGDETQTTFRIPRIQAGRSRSNEVKGKEDREREGKTPANGTMQNVKKDVTCEEEKKEGISLTMEVLR